MELTVLGSSGGYPEPGRACSGYLVRSRSTRIWVDAGTGTLDAILRILNLEDLDCILLSHLHPDHWTDLPIALHRLGVTSGGSPARPVPVYGPPDWPRLTGIADQWLSRGQSIYAPGEITPDASIRVGDVDISFAAVEHGMPTFAMRFTDGDNVLTYSADTSPCDALRKIASGADLFLCEATLPEGQETAISMNPKQAGEVARAADVRRLVLTHLLPGIDPKESCAVARRVFAEPVDYAEPGRTFDIGRPEAAR